MRNLVKSFAVLAVLTGVAIVSAGSQAQAQSGVTGGGDRTTHSVDQPQTPEDLSGTIWSCDNDPLIQNGSIAPELSQAVNQAIANGYNGSRAEIDNNVAPPLDIREINCVEDLLSQRFIPPTLIGSPPSLSDLIDEIIDRACEEVDRAVDQVHDTFPSETIRNDDLDIGVRIPGVRRRDMDAPILPIVDDFGFGGGGSSGGSGLLNDLLR